MGLVKGFHVDLCWFYGYVGLWFNLCLWVWFDLIFVDLCLWVWQIRVVPWSAMAIVVLANLWVFAESMVGCFGRSVSWPRWCYESDWNALGLGGGCVVDDGGGK